jgi:hypothetical protein
MRGLRLNPRLEVTEIIMNIRLQKNRPSDISIDHRWFYYSLVSCRGESFLLLLFVIDWKMRILTALTLSFILISFCICLSVHNLFQPSFCFVVSISASLFIYLSALHSSLSVCLFISLYDCLYVSVCLSVSWVVCSSACLSVRLYVYKLASVSVCLSIIDIFLLSRMFVSLSVCLSVSIICLTICLFVNFVICLSACLLVCLSVYQLACLSVHLSFNLDIFYLPISLSLFPSRCLSVWLSAWFSSLCLSVFWDVFLSVCLLVSLSILTAYLSVSLSVYMLVYLSACVRCLENWNFDKKTMMKQ